MESQQQKKLRSLHFSDQKITLVHAAIMEFLVTRRPSVYGLYPILNLIALYIQKPVLLVVFKRSLIKEKLVDGLTVDWVHSLPYPLSIKKQFDSTINELLNKASKKDLGKWVIDFSQIETDFSGICDDIPSLGILYFHQVFEDESTSTLDKRRKDAGSFLSKESKLDFLDERDIEEVIDLFSSIVNYRSSEKKDQIHLRYLADYWSQVGGQEESLFQRAADDKKNKMETGNVLEKTSIEQIVEILKPVLKEVDAIYREVRGGEPGLFDEKLPDDAGAPMLWARHRESMEAGRGVRPPTIAFFLQLRAPSADSVVKDHPEHGYRIVPVVTKSMCMDTAGMLLDHISRKGDVESVREYLRQLEIDPDEVNLNSVPELADSIYAAMRVENFLKWQYFHSVTYTAFSSGISTFTQAKAASKCDRIAYGTDFFAENGADTAFLKTSLVSGFPFITFMTKTRVKIGKEDEAAFSPFYFTYNFHTGIVWRWASRRIRRSMERAYTDGAGRALEEALIQSSGKVRKDSRSQFGFHVIILKNWHIALNVQLDRLAQAMPFAKICVSLEEESTDSEYFEFLGYKIYFRLERNKYYNRKLIDNDLLYIKPHKIKNSFEIAIGRAEDIWRAKLGN